MENIEIVGQRFSDLPGPEGGTEGGGYKQDCGLYDYCAARNAGAVRDGGCVGAFLRVNWFLSWGEVEKP